MPAQVMKSDTIQLQSSGKIKQLLLWLLVIVLLSIIGGGGFLLARHLSTATPVPSGAVANRAGCIGKNFNVGSKGDCVSDLQTMVDYMETAGLTECPFTGGTTLPVTGTYDQQTAAQVNVIQTWEDCYNKQEGSDYNIAINGIVGGTTWDELCTYAYHYPENNDSHVSPYRQASIAAGQAADCQQLFNS